VTVLSVFPTNAYRASVGILFRVIVTYGQRPMADIQHVGEDRNEQDQERCGADDDTTLKAAGLEHLDRIIRWESSSGICQPALSTERPCLPPDE